MKVLRTPDERFANVPNYPFAPNWVEVNTLDEPDATLRIHYLDEGPRDGTPVLMLHGEPTWSFLYRKMIPVFTAAGYRAIAPDLVGFGKSDKPGAPRDYSYARHVDWMRQVVEALDLREAVLVGQDWGSLIGLRLVAEHSDRFARVVIANGFLPTGDQPTPGAFKAWRAFSRYSPWFPIGRIVAAGCVDKFGSEIRAAYDAPFPSRAYTAGARVFPDLVPITPDDPAAPANRAAWETLGHWDKPFLTIFGQSDPILGRGDGPLKKQIPGTRDQPHERIRGGHFIQEDQGPYLAEAIVKWMA